ncbi:MAG TPA: MBL fold metallo-hydrolase [Phycisphaerales bacterium]|nr:MBL fold metallo-hydrolase [Phycisphaerales bacterium]
MRGLDRRSFLGVSAGALAAGLVSSAWAGRRAPGREPRGTFFTWHELRPGVHAAVDGSLGGNSLAVVSGSGVLLVDTKFPAFARALAREAAALGGKLTTIVNTHHHADHTGGNAVLNAEAEIIAHAQAAERIAGQLGQYAGMARGGPKQVEMERHGAEEVLTEAQAAAEAASAWTADDVTPDKSLSEWPHQLPFGEAEVTLHHFGAGHTDNDVVVHLPRANVVHTGDLCFHGLHPFFDPPGGATCRGWSESVARIIELCDGDTVVVPGHGELTDRTGLGAQKRYLDALWEHVSEEVAAGKSKEEVSAMRWGFMDGLGRDQLRPRAIGAVYDEVRGS